MTKKISYNTVREARSFLVFMVLTVLAGAITIWKPMFGMVVFGLTILTAILGLNLYEKAVTMSTRNILFEQAARRTRENNERAAVTDFDDEQLLAMSQSSADDVRQAVVARALEIQEEKATSQNQW